MTRLEGLLMHPTLKEHLLKDLKKRLACGGTVDGGALVFQGDHRERVQKELETLGYLVKRHGG
ncbi:MAG: translation initiation factor [Elusimicrobiota bacterium]